MAYRVDMTPQAVSDIESALQYIGQAAPTRIKRWLLGLIESAYLLEEMPERFPVSPESEELGIEIRQVLYGK